jgi:anti-sigma regulatory factor (Ser/Thr protein kinase)
VNDPLTASVTLPADATAARRGREVARRVCVAAGLSQEIQDTAELLTSETVTNAVLHGRSLPLLTVSAEGSSVRISVGDDNSRVPVIHRDIDLGALNGRGIQLLDSCAAEWGVAPDGHGGKVVWFTCD